MTAPAGSISLEGQVIDASNPSGGETSLAQLITGLEVKKHGFTVPKGGATHSVPLALSPTVASALVLCIIAPKTLYLILTGQSATPGPIKLYVKGVQLLTLAPGGGIVSMSVINPSTTDDIEMQILVGAQGPSGEVPEFYTD